MTTARPTIPAASIPRTATRSSVLSRWGLALAFFCVACGPGATELLAAPKAKPAPNAKTASKKPAAKPRKKPGFPAKLAGGERIAYKKVGDVTLHMHVFKPKGWKASDKRPAIVFFFGGGWMGGSPAQFQYHCRYLASRGMVAATAEYRVNRTHGTSPFECVKDGKAAVRFLRASAAKLGIDPKRVAAGGGSAGGHVAATTGVVPGFEHGDEDKSISSRPDAMCLFNPVIDTGPKGYGYSRLKERYKEISPVEHVTKDAPPTIIFKGTADTTTPIAGSRLFRDRMNKLGRRCELVEFEGMKHGFFNQGKHGNKPFVETVRHMDRFLASLGFLEGKPTIDDKGKW